MTLDIRYDLVCEVSYEYLFEDCLEAVSQLSQPEVRDVEVSLVIVDEATIQKLNLDYRNIDAVTDVLSFLHWEEIDRVFPGAVLGEVFICYPRVIQQANELGHSIEYELATLFIHGLWHLQGYDHITDGDFEQMREKELASLDIIVQKHPQISPSTSLPTRKKV